MAVPADANTLSGDEIRGLIQNRIVHLSIPYGVTLPLRYASNREVTGDLSGITLARMFAQRETGEMVGRGQANVSAMAELGRWRNALLHHPVDR